MFLVAPYSTDAPLYHYPIVTGSMIAANVVIYFATMFQVTIGNLEFEQIEWLMIQFNQINPLQWLTGNFMHFGFMHLLGNMLFLFCFGLVVEGKLGNMRFLAVYLASCVALGAVVQIPMYFLGSEELAGGASGVISTLMVIALFWAPENEISVFYWIMIVFAGTTEVHIITICVFFIAMDVFSVVMSGFAMSGAMGHTIGAIMGVPIALHYLRTGGVDCEGWDVVSRNDWMKEYPIFYSEKQRERDQAGEEEIENPVATALAITGGDVSKSKMIGLASTDLDAKRRKAKERAKTAAAPRGSRKKKKRRDSGVSPQQVAERCQAHPEFNRLAFVLRQSIQSGDLSSAQQTFLRLDALKLGCGLAESTLMQYATAKGNQRLWTDAIRPLAILIEKQGPMADDACLRLAQIQMKILKRNDLAIKTLEKIRAPEEGEPIDAAKQQQLQKRDQMLRTVVQGIQQ